MTSLSADDHIEESKFSLVKLAPVEAVLFDIDGTLCDSDPLHFIAFREMLQEIGFNGGVPIDEEFFIELAREQLKPVNGLYKVTKWIEERGLKRAAVTNAPRANAELIVSILGLSEFFQAIIVGSECERAKPFPDPYLKGLEAIKASKEHTFIFEDSVSGIKAGVAAGMPVIGITTRNPESLLMEAKPAFLIKDYEDQKLWAALEELEKQANGVKAAL